MGRINTALLAFAVFFLSTLFLPAQTVLISPTGAGGFEASDSSFTSNGWTLVNHATNKWVIGASEKSAGNFGVYVSNDSATNKTNNYTNSTSYSHFYRDITFPSGEGAIILTFKWKGNGEAGTTSTANPNDYLRVSLAPTTYTPVTTSTASATYRINDYILQGTSYGTVTIVIPDVNVNTSKRLIFTWANNASTAGTPPAAIDEISLISSAQSPLTGTKTIDPAGSGANNYTTFAAAINDLNANGVGTNGVTFNVAANAEFNEAPQTIWATGTSTKPIIFQKSGSGANPVLQGTGGIYGADYLLTISGSDYLTFDGIDFRDNPTNSTQTTMMERALLFEGAATDGCKNNTIKNSTITLNKTNSNSTYCVYISSAATATSGTNSSNYFYNNTVQNAKNAAYYFSGNSTYHDDDNRIGIENTGSSLVYNLGNAGTTVYGIYGNNQTNFKVFNTRVRSLTNTTTMYGIYTAGADGTFDIYNCRVDSLSSTTTIYPIYNTTGITINIYNDTINAVNTTGGVIYTMYLAGCTTQNVYSNVITNITNTSTTSTSTIYGMYVVLSGSTNNIYQNTIDGIAHSSTSATPTVYGIYISSSTANKVYRNSISNISHATTGAGLVYGIYIAGGTTNKIYNNFIYDIRANASTGSPGVRALGITSGIDSVYYNTVYLNGTATSASHQSAALYVTSPTALDLRNNIFVNAINVTTGTRAVAYYRTTSTYTNHTSTSGNNLFYAGAASSKNLLFYDGTNSDQTLAAMKSRLSPREASSVSEMPPFISASGTINLHISGSLPTQVESGGVEVDGYTDDYDGNSRTGYPLAGQVNGGGAAPDIGADEGDFIPLDVNGPTITFTQLVNSTATSTRSLSSFATITDPNDVNTLSGTRPRIYYKKYSNANTYNDNTSTTDGWKWAEASNTSSPFSFTIDYSKIYGGSVSAGDTIQYFVVAQDTMSPPNVGITSGTFNSKPSSVALTSSAFPLGGTIYSYRIGTALSGTKTVGTSGNYPTLTGVGGLFEAINSNVLSGSLTVNIISDLTETGTNALNQWAEEGGSNYTLTIQPNSTTMRTISGAVASGMIRLDGADRVKIDGRSGGSGQYLTFRNTNTSNPTITFINDATANLIRNCYLEGSGTGTASPVVLLSTSTGSTGNDNDTIMNCNIRDRSDVSGTLYAGIASTGTAGRLNSGNVIQNNNIFGWTNYGVYVSGTGNGDNWTISGNSFYQPSTITGTAAQYSIDFLPGTNSNGNTISSNIIGGTQANAGGTAWTNSSTGTFYGIYVSVGTTTSTAVNDNVIKNISRTSTGTGTFYGIYLTAGAVNVNNNLIGDTTSSAGITSSTTSTHYGIYVSPSGPSTITNNRIANISQTATGATTFYGIYVTTESDMTINANRIFAVGPTSSGTGTSVVTGIYLVGVSGNTTYNVTNNFISLGAGVSNNYGYRGIENSMLTGNTGNLYYNTVYIAGTGTGTTATYAYIETSTGDAISKNNIFYNVRSNTSTGKNYAIGSTTTTGAFTSNYNVLYTPGIPLGIWGSSDASDITFWRPLSNNDANSQSFTVNFTDANNADLHLSGSSIGDTRLVGTPISGLTTDFDNQTRSSTHPYIGADENLDNPLPVELTSFTLSAEGTRVLLNWNTASETKNAGFEVYRASDENRYSYRRIGSYLTRSELVGAGTNALGKNYSFADNDISIEKGKRYWYKLVDVSTDGKRNEHEAKSIEIADDQEFLSILSLSPNPSTDEIKAEINLAENSVVSFEIVSSDGRETKSALQKEFVKGKNIVSINTSDLASGSYRLQVKAENKEESVQFIIAR